MILLLGGTAETAPLAEALLGAGWRVLVSTASDAPLTLPVSPKLRRRCGALTPDALTHLLHKEQIRAVVDATHPYAVEITRTASAIATTIGLPYLRFERAAAVAPDAEGVLFAHDHAEAATLAFGQGGAVLLTTGSRNLAPYVAEARRLGLPLVARVLPESESLTACRAAGLAADEVVAERPPHSMESTLALLQRLRARALVSKDGGAAGGMADKLEAARRAGIPLVLVQRPQTTSDASFTTVVDLVQALQTRLQLSGP